MPHILFFNQDQIPDYRHVWNSGHMLPPATDRQGMLFRYPAAAQVCPDQMGGRNTYCRCELKEVIKIVKVMMGWCDGL
ncbi:MAG: hypothetical protein HF976_04100 [ANME-2 cluster archaeon]|nr:hypothetical protein [ANME-2 cluster archaeon]MBC2708729.1 hypothetical protein [ANME-2 cluster archaeon]MBC2747971.1 hypothetical protein [ANME-2 cluster archaeon]